MAKEFAKSFYRSTAWKKCRDGFIKSVFGLCQRCSRTGYIVHHKIVLTSNNINDPDITLNWDHLEYLCQDCHNKEHHGKDSKPIREGLMFDENGGLVRRNDSERI